MVEKDTGPILLSSGEFDVLQGGRAREILQQRQKLILSCAAAGALVLCAALLFDRCEKASDVERLRLANHAVEYEMASLKVQVASMDTLVRDLHVDRARLEQQNDEEAAAETRAGVLADVLKETLAREIKNGDARVSKKGAKVTTLLEGWAVLDDTEVSIRGVDLLVRVGAVLADPDIDADEIVVTAFTDATDRDPWSASAAQAASVAAFLEDAAELPGERLLAVGRGGNDPIGRNRARNRRVEISVEYR